jgi:hypothetical protein
MKRVRPPVIAVIAFVIMAAGCRIPQASMAPVPPDWKTLQGYGSLKFLIRGEAGRSRFSFVIEPPGRGRLVVADAFNRTLAEIFVGGDDGYFVLARDRAYWKAPPQAIFEKFIGFGLNLEEMGWLLGGRWKQARAAASPAFAGWELAEDGEGRTASGRKGVFSFKVLEYFKGSPVPRRVDFSSDLGRGRLTILSVAFETAAGPDAFRLDFLKTCVSKSWEEIEKIFRHDD